MMQMYNQQGITDNYPQYTTNFWGDSGNNYGFGSSNISSAISAHPAMNTAPVPIMQTAMASDTNSTVSRIWESAADGKRVYDHVLQQEGSFTPPDQNMLDYTVSAAQGGMNLLDNFSKIRKMNATDKYKHALMNCYAAQYGLGGADVATLASNLREWNDKRTGSNTLDSSNGDQYANRIGRLLGGKYPQGDCNELVQKYIDKNW